MQLVFSALLGGHYLLASSVIEDISLFEEREISAYLGIIYKSIEDYISTNQHTTSLWIFTAIIGVLLGLLLFGWCLLFIYYNTCGRKLPNAMLDKNYDLKDAYTRMTFLADQAMSKAVDMREIQAATVNPGNKPDEEGWNEPRGELLFLLPVKQFLLKEREFLYGHFGLGAGKRCNATENLEMKKSCAS
ncbi:unnamed protein product [Soboliphyme baturini]|uniref:Protein tweety homolog n=1 Tax=Soboliphyme baturini TaxID=241478 RepID=A0A183ILP5_9BILA|nr:unnamed protein product [Soboliphyme baturini]